MIKRFKNSLIRKGKKQRAERIYQTILVRVKKKNAIKRLFQKLIPKIRLLDRKKGRSTLKIPGLIEGEQGISIALRWFFSSVKERKEKKLEDRVVNEIKDILKGKARSLKKKEAYYKLAVYNRGFLRLFKRRKR